MKSKKTIKNLIKAIFNPNGKFNGKELEYVMEYLNTENSKTNNKHDLRPGDSLIMKAYDDLLDRYVSILTIHNFLI